MPQFYIDHREQWWIFDFASMFHRCFQCFSRWKPVIFHLLNINDSSTKHRWIINETMMNHRRKNSYAYVFCGWIQSNKITNSFHKSIFPITWTKNVCQEFDLKSKRAINQTLTEKISTAILKIDFTRNIYGRICSKFAVESNWNSKYPQNGQNLGLLRK